MNKEIPSRYRLIDPKLITEIKTNKTSLGENSLIPMELNDNKFLSNLFLDRFDTLHNRTVSVMGTEDLNKRNIISTNFASVKQAIMEEESHIDELIALAFKIVEDSFDIRIGQDVIVNAKLGMVEMNKATKKATNDGNIRLTPTTKNKVDAKNYNDVKRLNKEVEKRRLINALTQGVANTFNSVFYLYEDELNAINPKLFNIYRTLIPTSEIFYYLQSLENTPLVSGGLTEVDTDEEKVGINATALVFPILVHEIIKGIFDLISLNGLPDDDNEKEYILERSDYLLAEGWDMLLGIPLWGKIANIIPNDMAKDTHQVFFELCLLDLDKASEMLPNIFGNTEDGIMYINEMCKRIKKEKQEDEFSEYMRDLDSSDDDYLSVRDL